MNPEKREIEEVIRSLGADYDPRGAGILERRTMQEPNTDMEWLKRQAELEDCGFVSVGGLVTKLGAREKIIIIPSCAACPYGLSGFVCGKTHLVIPDEFVIPEFCPLQDRYPERRLPAVAKEGAD